jgi:flagellar protein FliO/FliZ
MDASVIVVALRVAVSLGVVLALLWWLSRRAAGGRGRTRPSTLSVVGRASVSRHASVTVVEVEGRRLLLGVTDQKVNLITELTTPAVDPAAERTEIEPEDLAAIVDSNPQTAPAADTSAHPSTPAARTPAVPKQRSPLEGSVLDVTVWRQAVAAMQERTIRR